MRQAKLIVEGEAAVCAYKPVWEDVAAPKVKG